MFGLEGSGFIVCLGLTLLLIGLIMFYVRQRFSEQEDKINKLIAIIPVMTQQIELHENLLNKGAKNTIVMNGSGGGVLSPIDEGVEDNRILVSPEYSDNSDNESDDSDEDSVSDTDSDDDNSNIEVPTHDITIGAELTNMISVKDVEEKLTQHVQETMLENERVKVISLGNSNEEPSVSEINTTKISNDESDVDDDDDSTSETDSEDNNDDNNHDNMEQIKVTQLPASEHEITIPITQTSLAQPSESSDTNLDYAKLNVKALREIISEKKLTKKNINKLKKDECLSLLTE